MKHWWCMECEAEVGLGKHGRCAVCDSEAVELLPNRGDISCSDSETPERSEPVSVRA